MIAPIGGRGPVAPVHAHRSGESPDGRRGKRIRSGELPICAQTVGYGERRFGRRSSRRPGGPDAQDIPARGDPDRARAGGRAEPRPARPHGQGMAPARLRPVGRGPELRLPRRRGLVAGAVPARRHGEGRDVRQPADRGQPAQLPPGDRHPVRPRRRLGHLGGPLDGGGEPARRRAARLPRGHPRRRPGRARAGPHGLHDPRLRLRRQDPAGGGRLRLLPGAGHPGLAPQHRQGLHGPDRRPAARPHRHRREPAHGLLPEPRHRRRSTSTPTR